MKKKTAAILSSCAAIAISASLIAGSTYALFTSESKVNIAVTSGKVDVTATIDEDTLALYSAKEDTQGTLVDENGATYIYDKQTSTTFANGGTAAISDGTLTLTNITPGDKVEFDIDIVNNSNVTIKYQINYAAEDKDTVNPLSEALQVTTVTNDVTLKAWSLWEKPAENATEKKTVSVSVELPITVGNEYQDKSVDLAFTVKAVQGNAKTEDVEYELNDEDGLKAVEDSKFQHYEVSNINGLFLLQDKIEKHEIAWGTTAKVETIVDLVADIDLAGYVWKPMDGQQITFNGNNHTISNVNAGHTSTDKSAFFSYNGTINDLTLRNVTARGSQAGAFTALSEGAKINNCRLEGSVNISYENFADTPDYNEDYSGLGVFVGVINGIGAEIKGTLAADVTVNLQGLDAENSAILNNRTEQLLGGLYINDVKGTYKIEVNTDDANITIIDANDTLISSKADLTAFAQAVNGGKTFKGETVFLMTDIDLANEAWTPIGNLSNSFQGTFEGNGHTISNLNCQSSDVNVGLFGVATGGAILQNFTLKNVNINGQAQVGAVAGEAFTAEVISNVNITGNVKIEGNYKVGGITGDSYGKIENCSVKANAGSYVKGVYLEGVNNREGDNVGGIIGYTGEHGSFGTAVDRIINCTVENLEVIGTRKVGGIVGYANYGVKVDGCSFSDGKITISASDEYAQGNKTFAGGIVGEYTDSTGGYATITNNSVSNVVITGIEGFIGEVVGGTRGTGTSAVITPNTTTNVTLAGK